MVLVMRGIPGRVVGLVLFSGGALVVAVTEVAVFDESSPKKLDTTRIAKITATIPAIVFQLFFSDSVAEEGVSDGGGTAACRVSMKPVGLCGGGGNGLAAGGGGSAGFDSGGYQRPSLASHQPGPG